MTIVLEVFGEEAVSMANKFVKLDIFRVIVSYKNDQCPNRMPSIHLRIYQYCSRTQRQYECSGH